MAYPKQSLSKRIYWLITAIMAFITINVSARDYLSTSFRVLQLGKLPMSELHFQSLGGDITQLYFNRIAKSPFYHYEGENPIAFFEPITDPQTGIVSKNQLLTVYVPSHVHSPLIFVQKNSPSINNDGLYTSYMVDEAVESFPARTLIAVNTTGQPLLAKIGRQSLQLSTGVSPPISVIDGTASAQLAEIELGIYTDDGFKLIFSRKLLFKPNQRCLLVIAPPRQPGSIQALVYRVSDNLPQENFLRITQQ